jgi:Protein of unknown function (DUF3237)
MRSRKKFLTTVGVGLAGVVLGSNRGSQKVGTAPQLEFAFTANITLGTVQEVGDTPHGRRRIIPITGGFFEGPSIRGTVEPVGADWQIIRPDNVAELEIYIVNKGYRHGPAEVIQRLAKGEPVDPNEYYFRASPVFETASEKYNYLNKYVYLASGERKKESVVIHFYKVL